ncbi:hypothetical protein [Methylobacterium sp. J-076]|uniref:hypothetical protein n=1 Tax=Methylobacterium sp. J-076 TaxID=2836655 RepID=UPI001FBA2E0C|nr:hypothetical protein [Methylobacterium sp. J-076]MCJ2012120.1 hypothetical protein [Methylobacterium sp. J-076]
MKTISVCLDDLLFQRVQAAAARAGKSPSDYLAEAVERHVGNPVSQSEALARFLAGPPLPTLDGDGRAPSRDQRYE